MSMKTCTISKNAANTVSGQESKNNFTLRYKSNASNFVREDVTYGLWSDWQDGYIYSSDNLEVETRTQSTPKRYHYAHYGTGYISDKESRYKEKG